MNNTYGTGRPAIVTSDDVEIYYSFRPSRGSDGSSYNTFKKLDSSCLAETAIEGGETLPGVFDLRLPLAQFSEKGIYTVYIRPKEIRTKIIDVSTLAAYPDVRGIIIDSSSLGSEIESGSNGISGYRVDYFDNSGQRMEMFRLITSSNRCEPVAQNINDSSQKGIRYRYNEASNFIFCTVTPSNALSFKSSTLPDIGSVGQDIAIINTKFDPVCLEIEMTENDADTLADGMFGDQARVLDTGQIVFYDSDGNITRVLELSNMKNSLGETKAEVKRNIIPTDTDSISHDILIGD